MEDQNPLFIEGFNGGYLLEQYEPELLAKVLKDVDLSNEYLAGMSSGQKELQQEQLRARLEELSRLRDEGKEIDKSQSR